MEFFEILFIFLSINFFWNFIYLFMEFYLFILIVYLYLFREFFYFIIKNFIQHFPKVVFYFWGVAKKGDIGMGFADPPDQFDRSAGAAMSTNHAVRIFFL